MLGVWKRRYPSDTDYGLRPPVRHPSTGREAKPHRLAPPTSAVSSLAKASFALVRLNHTQFLELAFHPSGHNVPSEGGRSST